MEHHLLCALQVMLFASAPVQVWQLPPQAEVLASSEKTGVEMFRCGGHIMGIQGHPEYNKDILLHLIDRQLQRNLIQVRPSAFNQTCLSDLKR